MIEIAPLREVEATNVGVFLDAVHCEVLTPPTQGDPFPGLLGEFMGFGEGDEADPRFGVPGVALALAPRTVLHHGCSDRPSARPPRLTPDAQDAYRSEIRGRRLREGS